MEYPRSLIIVIYDKLFRQSNKTIQTDTTYDAVVVSIIFIDCTFKIKFTMRFSIT
jgi:hypothetical protein